MLQSMGLQRVGHDMTEQLGNNNNIRRYLNCLQVTKTRNYAVRYLIGGKATEGKREVSAKEDEDGSKTVVRPAPYVNPWLYSLQMLVKNSKADVYECATNEKKERK